MIEELKKEISLKVNKIKNKEMKKTIIVSAFVSGIILTVFTYQAITIYQQRTRRFGGI